MIRSPKGRLSKAEHIYDCLRAEIIAGSLAPGDALDKAELAARFGASRQPIANAVERLAYEGLAQIVPQHGSFVSKLNAGDVLDRFFIRKALEAEFSMQLAAGNADHVLKQLDINLKYQAIALEAGDYNEFYDLDLRFHAIIRQPVPVPEANRILDQAEAHLSRARRLLLPRPGRGQKTLKEHEAIRAGIASGNPLQAADAMRAHIDGVACDFEQFAATRPELFDLAGSEPEGAAVNVLSSNRRAPASGRLSAGRPI